MSKITYTNKVAINENAEIPDINKITDDNMNEIKIVVNNNDDIVTNVTTYSTDEIRVGTWMNKPLYRKVLLFNNISGTGGDYSIAEYNLNIDEIAWFTAHMVQLSNKQYEMPYYVSSTDKLRILVQVSSDNIIIQKGSSMSDTNKVTIILYYTKTTD